MLFAPILFSQIMEPNVIRNQLILSFIVLQFNFFVLDTCYDVIIIAILLCALAICIHYFLNTTVFYHVLQKALVNRYDRDAINK